MNLKSQVENLKEDIDSYTRLQWWQPQDLLHARRLPGTLRVLAIWLAVCVICISTGLLTTTWSGIAVRLGILTFDISFYPPLALSVLRRLELFLVFRSAPDSTSSFLS